MVERKIKILDENKFFFTPTKHSYSKEVKRLKMWKKMGEQEEAWASKVGLVTLLTIEWKEPYLDAFVEFLNTFVIKETMIYFGKMNIVYVSSKHMIVNAFGVCNSGYVENPHGHVTKTLVEELLFKHDIKPPYTNAN